MNHAASTRHTLSQLRRVRSMDAAHVCNYLCCSQHWCSMLKTIGQHVPRRFSSLWFICASWIAVCIINAFFWLWRLLSMIIKHIYDWLLFPKRCLHLGVLTWVVHNWPWLPHFGLGGRRSPPIRPYRKHSKTNGCWCRPNRKHCKTNGFWCRPYRNTTKLMVFDVNHIETQSNQCFFVYPDGKRYKTNGF